MKKMLHLVDIDNQPTRWSKDHGVTKSNGAQNNIIIAFFQRNDCCSSLVCTLFNSSKELRGRKRKMIKESNVSCKDMWNKSEEAKKQFDLGLL